MNKFNAKKVKASDGQIFDSQHEYQRYCILKLLERAGKISDLKRQVTFELVPEQREPSTEVFKRGPRKGQPKPGKLIEQAVTYVADFTYNQNGQYIVEDAKGCKKGAAYDLFVCKRKLMLWVHGIRIKET